MTLTARRLLRSHLPETILLSALTLVLVLVSSPQAADPPKEAWYAPQGNHNDLAEFGALDVVAEFLKRRVAG